MNVIKNQFNCNPYKSYFRFILETNNSFTAKWIQWQCLQQQLHLSAWHTFAQQLQVIKNVKNESTRPWQIEITLVTETQTTSGYRRWAHGTKRRLPKHLNKTSVKQPKHWTLQTFNYQQCATWTWHASRNPSNITAIAGLWSYWNFVLRCRLTVYTNVYDEGLSYRWSDDNCIIYMEQSPN